MFQALNYFKLKQNVGFRHVVDIGSHIVLVGQY